MSLEALLWALDEAPIPSVGKGNGDAAAKLVLIALAERADKRGRNSWPTMIELQLRTQQDRRTVQRALKRLANDGLIVHDGLTSSGCNRWNLAMHRRRDLDTERKELEERAENEKRAAAERARKSRAPRADNLSVTGADNLTAQDADSADNLSVTCGQLDRTPLDGADNLSARADNLTPIPSYRPSPSTALEPPAPPASPDPPKGADTTRGHRLPDDFPVTDAMRKWAQEKAPDCGAEDHAAFCDYWRDQAGAKGRKVSWVGTWRNWMRRAQADHERRGTGRRTQPQVRRSTSDDRVAQAQALKAELGLIPDAPGAPQLSIVQGEIA